ncbi:MAG TPA: glycosyltransferase family 1 protein [Candidatus Hydrogenedentes bacterium]|nr:glycosyltransferase family 1 protein [Candidatus Hydrogenedentota bacterium]HOS02423.1 glycosyltransferase family 1 protein [Candidatus Hydrogenedentota bacterium]
MRIGVTTFGGDSGKSGISQYMSHLLQRFPAIAPDIEFEVILYKDETDMFLEGVTGADVCHACELFRPPTLNLLWHQIGLPLLCARRGYDLLFIPAGNRRLPFWTPCPIVANVMDLSALHIAGKYDRLHSFYNLRVLPMLIRRLTGILTLSESSKQDIIEYVGAPEESICVVPLAADPVRYFPGDKQEAQQRIRQRYGVEPPYILYISRIEHPGKNHVRLIRAFEKIKIADRLPHRLVIAGSDWTRAEEVHRQAEASPCRQDIVFTGFAPQSDLPDLYRGADVFCFPSLFEGFGMPVLEAMACGTPVACSNCSSIPEVAGNAGVLFDPLSEESIAEALSDLLAHEDKRQRCREEGIARSKEYSWENTASRTIEALLRFARQPSGSTRHRPR